MASMTQEVSGAPRAAIPSTYVMCSRDRAVHPAHQQVMAERCAQHHVLDTDHSPFLSAVDSTADLIEQIVTAS
jgi:hypothetical protein